MKTRKLPQRQVNFWIRVETRPQWEALRERGIPPGEILNRGIDLVYEEETKAEDKTEFYWRETNAE